MINSVSGSMVGEWWSIGYWLQANGLQRLVSEADFIPLWLTSNDGRTYGAPDSGLIGHTWTISTMSKNPDKAMDFMDFFNTDDGWYLAWYGVEELDFVKDGIFPIRTEVGLTRYRNMVLDSLYGIGNRLDIANFVVVRPTTDWSELTRQKWEVLQQDNSQPSYTSAFYGIPAPREQHEYGVDVDNWIEWSAMAFITGETPLNDANWNNYIDTWRRMGGVRILQGYVDAYNSIRGITITAGIN